MSRRSTITRCKPTSAVASSLICLALAGCQTPALAGLSPWTAEAAPTDPTALAGRVPTLTSPWTSTAHAVAGARTVPDSAPVRFIAVGDAGEGNDAQYAVSEAIEQVCARRGCDFAVYLGDNFYSDGVDSVDDEQFQTKFEDPYANLDLPFFVVNGNHDLNAGDDGFDAWKTNYYVEYSDRSEKWTMPAPYYSAQWGDVELFGLDTTQLVYGDEEQADWLRGALDTSDAPWKIVYGHHPYRSNGAHGNADGALDSVFQDVVCDRASVYLAGHDHNMQWLEPSCGVELIVSGVGAKTTPLEERANQTFFETDEHEGFMWIEIDGDEMRGTFFDRDATELFTMSVER